MMPAHTTPPCRLTLLIAAYLALTALFAPLLSTALMRKHRALGPQAVARSGERLGFASLVRPDGPLVWINAASVGEVMLIAGLVDDLETRGVRVLITTTTATGAETVKVRLPSTVLHQFLPFDLPNPVGRFLDYWRPDLAVFTEADLWPRLWETAAKRGLQISLVNARASTSRTRFPATAARLLGLASLIAAQDAGVADDICRLGVPRDRVLTGDLRQEAARLPVPSGAIEQARDLLGQWPVWLAASTHDSDSTALWHAAKVVTARHPDAILIEAPRHPERADAIARGWFPRPVARRSRGEVPEPGGVYLADTLGEMGLFYRLCPLVYLGGGLGTEGGHNPQEPAVLGCLVLHGPQVAHHRAAFAQLTGVGRAVEVADGEALGHMLVARLGMTALPIPVMAPGNSFRSVLADQLCALIGGG